MQTHLQKLQQRQQDVEERQRVRRMEIVSKLLQEEELREKEAGLREKQMQAPPPATQSIMGNSKRLERILQKLETPAAEPQPPVTAATQGAGLRGMSDSSSDQSTDEDDSDMYSEEEEGSQSDESLSEPTAAVESEGAGDLESDIVTQHVTQRAAAACLVPRRKKSADTHTRTHTHTRPPFSCKPHTLHFKDFELGKVYRRRVVLTNVTYSTNQLRLLGLTHTLNSCVALSFQPPGPMSPGMSCEMEAVFTPVLNVDLEGDVCFTSAAGDFSLPVTCSTKKCQVSVDCSKVLFGSHVVGQRVSRSIVLTNSGARGTRYFLLPVSSPNHAQTHHTSPSPSSSTKMCVSRVECERSESPQQTSDNRTQQHTPDIPSGSVSAVVCVNDAGVVEEGESVCVCESPSAEQDACSPQAASPDTHTHTNTHTHTHTHTTTHTHTHTHTLSHSNSTDDAFPEIQLPEMREGVCAAFSKVKIPLLFNPMIPGDTHLDFIINFSDPDCPPISVSVCGTAVSAPVCVVDPDLDLKICCYGRLYQHTLTLHSRASKALRVVFSVCKELRRHVEILPKTAYIQAHSTYQAQLKFLPRLSLPEDAGLFFHKDTGVLEAPLTVNVAEQTAPLRVMLHAVVTGSEVVCV
ncbi:cilia- and flagella-associated protein 74-like [Engraulis encrasicolus]|uniref:cilia- and flagella-associated protein 74-like n=1 Tax=Engraulis encrasicolus TaxID=184585 RepID=UPI002FCFC423